MSAQAAEINAPGLSFDQIFDSGVKLGDVKLNLLQLRTALRNNPEMFIHFFLSETLSEEVPDFHIENFFTMTHADIDRLLILIPRGHAKTMLAKLTAAWYLIFSAFRFVLYVSGSHDLVVPYVNDIADFFRSRNFQAVFGGVEWLKEQDGIGVYKFRITATGKVCILRGLGAGQRVRGINVENERPQLAICDDMEDDEDVGSEELHRKKLQWFYGSFLKCLDPMQNKVIASGNLLGKRSIMYKLLHNQRWHSVLYSVLRADGTPLWEAAWPLEKIKADFQEYQELGLTARWFAEMMNQPVAEGGSVIKAEEISYNPAQVPEDIKYGFLTLDPAISKEKWADSFALVAHAWIETTEQWQVVQVEHGKGIRPEDLFWRIVAMGEYWGFYIVGVEVDAMQKVLEYFFDHLKYLHNKTHFIFVPVSSGGTKKPARIATWASALKKPRTGHSVYALTTGDFVVTQELLEYQPMIKDNVDNIIDSCAYGMQMISVYLIQIMQQLSGPPPQQVQSIYRIAAV